MSRWRGYAEQVGGRNAISIWSWLITIPLTLLISSTYRAGVSAADVATWVGIVLAVHVLIGIAMWVALKTILPNTDRRSRPLTALVFFGLLGLFRAVILQGAQDIVGISAGIFSERLAVSIVGAIVALAAIAIIVDDYRTDEGIVQRLEKARAALSRLRDVEEVSLRAADLEVLAQVQARVEAELLRAGTDSSRIREIADGIVRPISHELAQSADDEIQMGPPQEERRIRLTFAGAFGRMQTPLPLAVAVVVEASVIGAVGVRFGPVVAIANALIGGGLILIGCILLRRVMPLPRSPLVRLITLGIALAALGAVAAVITSLVLDPIASTFPAGLIGVTGGVAGAGIALSLWDSVNAGRRDRQQALSDAVADEAAEIERLRGLVGQRRLQAARFLHGAIQGELVAAALRHDSPERIRDVVAARFSQYGVAETRGAELQVQDLIAAWSTVLDITITADPACWPLLDGRPERLQLLVDSLSEGLTNVVRHAVGSCVEVRITMDAAEVALLVTSEGAPREAAEPGIGLAQLQARGARVSLGARGDRTEFAAAV